MHHFELPSQRDLVTEHKRAKSNQLLKEIRGLGKRFSPVLEPSLPAVAHDPTARIMRQASTLT